ncbi:MAG: hypothetical protein GF311_06370, partial [Candidatus Lokiarchaeota archaeon]|nr:hypothetical protein [Candidatus Lokiarchaeota archaeon]
MSGIIDNRKVKLIDVIKAYLKDLDVEKIYIAVGYFYISGLQKLYPELKDFMDRGGEIYFIIGNSINRKTYEDLVQVYKDLSIASSKQRADILGNDDKNDLIEKT